MPALIRVALLKRLFDEPDDERKFHTRRIPTIGGILIFAGTLFSFAIWFPIQDIHDYQEILKAVDDFKYIIATILVLFFIGIKDDIIGTAPVKKLAGHIIVGMVLVLMADVRISGFHGIFGIFAVSYWASVFLSLFTYIVIVNAFNLIDGVDGLAGGVGLIAALAFAAWFYFAGDEVMASLALAVAGSLLAFLIFNFSPAKIFMGDSGSLSIGLILCVLALKMIEFDKVNLNPVVADISKPVFAMSVLVYPLIDTLRVFIYRSLKGLSPFAADRNHIHHKLMDMGLGHKGTVICIYVATIFIITLAVITQKLSHTYSFLIVAGSAIALSQIPFIISNRRQK